MCIFHETVNKKYVLVNNNINYMNVFILKEGKLGHGCVAFARYS